MSTALKHLQNFIRAKNTDDERGEIRAYVKEHAAELAEAFGVSLRSFVSGVDFVGDDAKLAERLVAEIKRSRETKRAAHRTARAGTAQASADVLGAASYWDRDRAVVDIVSLVASTLTSPRDLLVFEARRFDTPVAIPMAPLFDLARLERADFSAFVDAEGLHVRWATGGLNLLPVIDDHAERVIVHLPPRQVAWRDVTEPAPDNDNAHGLQAVAQ